MLLEIIARDANYVLAVKVPFLDICIDYIEILS